MKMSNVQNKSASRWGAWFLFLLTSKRFFSKMIAKLNAGDFDGVPAEMKDVIFSGGRIAPGLIPRREEETQLFSRK